MAVSTGITRIKLAVLVLLPVTLVSLDLNDFAPLELGRDAVQDALSPLISGVSRITRPVADAWNAVGGYEELRQENELLRAEVEELRGRLSEEVRDSELLGQVLEELEIPYINDMPRATARVIRQLGSFSSLNVDLDKGTDSGIEVGMPAVTSEGLVGRVIETSRTRSKVRLITDKDFELGVRIVGLDTVSVAKGGGAGRALVVGDGVPLSVDVRPGLMITTSGIANSVYPPDIPVGVIQEIRVDPDLNQVLFLRPLASLEALDFVSILLYDNVL